MKRYTSFIWATLLLLGLIAALSAWSLSNARATAYNSLRSQGEALAEAIERSALYGFRTEHVLGQQFLETFQNQIQQLDEQLNLAKDQEPQKNLLRDTVNRYRWDFAVIIDGNLQLVVGYPHPGELPLPGSSPPADPSKVESSPGPGSPMGWHMGMGRGPGRGMGTGMRGMGPSHRIQTFVEGPDTTMVLQGPNRHHPWGLEPYLVAHKRDNGQVLLARASLERMQEAFNPASVQTLFRTLALGKTIVMVALADDNGTIGFASDDAWVGKPLTDLDRRLQNAPAESIQVQRTLESADNEPRGRLLLALATDPAHRYLAQTRRSVALMGIVTFAIGLTGIVAIAWMQRRGLHREAQMQLTVIRAKRLAALGQMAGQVAHEIRNPLNAISLSLQNLRRQLQDGADAGPAAEWEGYLDTTQSELLRLNRIVEDYLSVSRFPPIHRQDVDLSAWLAEIVALYAEPAQEAGITVQLTVPPQPLRFLLDPDQMRQALGNLMLNAIQASPPDTPIKVTLRPERRGVVMEVEDRGAGIATDDLERVFELYYTTRPAGSGLGLPIALRIIEDHGGTLQIKSGPGKGTTAWVFLPRNG